MLWFLVAGFTAVFLAHTAPFPSLLERFTPSKSLWHVPRGTGPPTIYLTYDDGPNPNATPALLDVLRDGGAHATFFLIDAHLTEATAPIVRRMFDECNLNTELAAQSRPDSIKITTTNKTRPTPPLG